MAEELPSSASGNACSVSLLDSLDHLSWYPVANEELTSEPKDLVNLPTCSLVNESYNDPHLLCVDRYSREFYYEDFSESEDSDNENEEFKETIEQFEDDEDVSLLTVLRKMIEENIYIRDLLVILRSKVRDRYRNLPDDSDHPMLNFEEANVQKISEKNFALVNVPYFKDQSNFPCWDNDDVKLSTKFGFACYKKKSRRKRWTPLDRRILCSCIKEQLIEKEISRLKSNQKDFMRKLNLEEDEVEAHIAVTNREIETLWSKSLFELMEGKSDWEFDWDRISVKDFKESRTSHSIRQYWHLYFKPSINKGPWSNKEDKSLLNIVKQHNYQDWDAIVQELGTNRSPIQAFIHFKVRFIDENKDGGSLSCDLSKEDETTAMESQNLSLNDEEINRRKLREMIRQNKQIDDVDKKIVRGRFTTEEDMLILSGIQEFGFDPIMLSGLLKHRTTSQIISRYKTLKPDQTILGPWRLHEDQLLLRLVKEHGFGKWSKIAKQFITRNRTQVRHRYSALEKQMNHDEEFNVEEMKRYKVRKVWNKSGDCDNIVEKVRKRIKACKFDLRDEDPTSKVDQIIDLKRHLFLKKSKKRQWKVTTINKQLIDFFHEKCHAFKNIRKLDFENISELALNTLCSLVYLNASNLKTFTKNDVENDDRVNDLLKSVLIDLMYENVFEFKLDLVKRIVIGMSNDVGISTSDQEPIIRRCRSESPVESIDSVPIKQEDSLIELKDQWLFPEMDISKAGLSWVIEGRLDEFSYGVFQFLKKDTTQQISSNEIGLQKCSKLELPDILSYSNKFYKLPINVSSIICLRTMELARPKLESTLLSENKIIVRDPNSQSESEHDDIPEVKCLNYTRKHAAKDYVSQKAMNLPATKLFVRRLCNLLGWTSVIRGCNLDEKKPERLNRNVAKNLRLKRKQIKETYIKELQRNPKPTRVNRKATREDTNDDTQESS